MQYCLVCVRTRRVAVHEIIRDYRNTEYSEPVSRKKTKEQFTQKKERSIQITWTPTVKVNGKKIARYQKLH